MFESRRIFEAMFLDQPDNDQYRCEGTQCFLQKDLDEVFPSFLGQQSGNQHLIVRYEQKQTFMVSVLEIIFEPHSLQTHIGL